MHNNHNHNDVDSLLSTNIPDPTDFPSPSKAPGLRLLDAALRCSICGELFQGPVTLPCGHCFCSLCVRPVISEKQQCPQCRREVTEIQLRVNPVVESAISAWSLARPYILELARQEQKRLEDLTRDVQTTPTKSGSSKKRKRSQGAQEVCRSSHSVELVAGPSQKRHTSSSTPAPRTKILDDEDDVEMTVVPSSDPIEEEVEAHTSKSIKLVTCPMCNKSINLDIINTHLDQGCSNPDSSRSKKEEWSKIMGPKSLSRHNEGKGKGKESPDTTDHPLPKLTYASLKDKQLKGFLSEHKLPVNGDRATLISRHSRWVMTHNANLDKSPSLRSTKQQLRADLKKWEDEPKAKKQHVGDIANHQKTYRKEFAELVKTARAKVKVKVEVKSPSPSPSPSIGNLNSDLTAPDLDSPKASSSVPGGHHPSESTPTRKRTKRETAALRQHSSRGPDEDEDVIVVDSECENEELEEDEVRRDG